MVIRISALCVFVLMKLSAVTADEIDCDPQILAAAYGQFGYKAREDRCEGSFQQPTSLGSGPASLSIISFACVDPELDLRQVRPSIGWGAPLGSSVAVRMETLPEIRLRYRLDARGPAGQNVYSWDGAVLKALSIKATEVGILVTGSPQLAGVETPGTLLLARLSGAAQPSECTSAPLLAVRTLKRVATVRVCVAELRSSGERADEDLVCRSVEGQFSPRTSIKIPLDELRVRKGMFQLTITAHQVGRDPEQPALFRLTTR